MMPSLGVDEVSRAYDDDAVGKRPTQRLTLQYLERAGRDRNELAFWGNRMRVVQVAVWAGSR
jgi:hypothetical protein